MKDTNPSEGTPDKTIGGLTRPEWTQLKEDVRKLNKAFTNMKAAVDEVYRTYNTRILLVADKGDHYSVISEDGAFAYDEDLGEAVKLNAQASDMSKSDRSASSKTP